MNQLSQKFFDPVGFLLAALVLYAFYKGLYVAPTDANMGEVYRIIYVHVPSAASSFLAGFILLVFFKYDETLYIAALSNFTVAILAYYSLYKGKRVARAYQ